MSSTKNAPRKTRISAEQRSRRIQQVLFAALALVVVASMIIAAFAH